MVFFVIILISIKKQLIRILDKQTFMVYIGFVFKSIYLKKSLLWLYMDKKTTIYVPEKAKNAF